MRKCVNWLFLAGAGLLLVVVILIFHYVILPYIIHKQVAGTLALNNGTDAYDRFVKLPVPLYFSVYFFNLVNPEGVFEGQKPIVQEVGPWVYKETREKFNVEFDDEKDTAKYQQRTNFEFDPERSHPRTENDLVHPGNIIPQVIMRIGERISGLDFLTELVEFGLPEVMGKDYSLILNRTVGDILFNGIDMHCSANASLGAQAVCSMVRHFPGINSLKQKPNGDLSAGILSFRNGSSSDVFEIYRGNKDFSKIGIITSLNGKTSVTNWFGEECNQVAGSYDESILQPFLSEGSSFKVYGSDICTTTPLASVGETTALDVDCLRFAPGDNFLGSVTDHPENYCYCPGSIHDVTSPQACMKKGVLEFSTCQGVPIVLSFPHFYRADTLYQNAVGGLNPNAESHETYIDIEPTTGVPVKAAKRIQVNVQFKGSPALKITGKARDVLLPFMWIDESVQLEGEQLALIKDQLIKMLRIANIIKWVVIAAGLLMLLVGGLMAYVSVRAEHRHPD
uniref:Sensory neuron membrane protein 2 n=1 Tax=Cyrtorhinus lividipennis TaxID=1032904 RepID=A0A346TI36_9HEMI|nr:sensory neuron membrane protein 2-2 [Cyrtorhinus lividipennis]